MYQGDPFSTIDIDGVGLFIKQIVNKFRNASSKILLGASGQICGEPKSISYFHELGINILSCSADKIPVMKLILAKKF